MKKGFMKTMALFMVLLVLVVAGVIFYLNNQDKIEEVKEDAKATVQEKKEEAISEMVEEGKKNVGEILKDAGEKMIEDNTDSTQEKESDQSA